MKLIKLSASLFLGLSLLSCSSAPVVQQAEESVVVEDRQIASDQIEPVMWELPKKDFNGNVIESNANYQKRLPRMKLWTAKLYELIAKETSLVSSHPIDAEFFCANYKNLGPNQRMNFWAQLIAAISYRESEWVPTTRMREPKEYVKIPGTNKTKLAYNIDHITGQPVVSEGLMQLSYQDSTTYSDWFDCEFSWKKDKGLDANSSEKTILAPYRNLRCGLRILNHKVKINNQISTPKTYWSVLRPVGTNRYSKIPWITKQTQSLSFCAKKTATKK